MILLSSYTNHPEPHRDDAGAAVFLEGGDPGQMTALFEKCVAFLN